MKMYVDYLYHITDLYFNNFPLNVWHVITFIIFLTDLGKEYFPFSVVHAILLIFAIFLLHTI